MTPEPGVAVSDLNRLGKRGAYRLGRLGTPAPAPAAPPGPHYPSSVPGHRGPVLFWLLGSLAAVALIALGAAAGWWFVPFVAWRAGPRPVTAAGDCGSRCPPPRWWRRSAGASRSPGRRPTAPRSGPPRGWSRRWPGCRRRLGRDRGHPAGRGPPGPGRPVAGLGADPETVAAPGGSSLAQGRGGAAESWAAGLLARRSARYPANLSRQE